MKKVFIIIAILFVNSIYAQESSSYVENELIVWLEQGVDAAEFATNSNQGIMPNV